MEPFYDDEVDVRTAKQLVDDGAFLLDVRTDDEWNAGHAPQATHVELQTVPARTGELPADQTIAVICKAGGRSAQATAFLNGNGYKAVNVAGGMLAWHEAGLPAESTTGAPPAVI